MKSTSEGINPGFETQSRSQPKSKTGVSVAIQKGLISSNKRITKKLNVGCLRECVLLLCVGLFFMTQCALSEVFVDCTVTCFY